jgi:hypothetical protein
MPASPAAKAASLGIYGRHAVRRASLLEANRIKCLEIHQDTTCVMRGDGYVFTTDRHESISGEISAAWRRAMGMSTLTMRMSASIRKTIAVLNGTNARCFTVTAGESLMVRVLHPYTTLCRLKSNGMDACGISSARFYADMYSVRLATIFMLHVASQPGSKARVHTPLRRQT